MKRIIWAVFLLCLFPFPAAYGWPGKVVKVLDGDSLLVKKGQKIIEVRLYGIDCPEWGQEYGKKAKQFSTAQLQHQTVDVESIDVDGYGRTVAIVSSSSGRMINRELVRAGYAWTYKQYCKKKSLCSEFNKLEKEAREHKQGLWKEKEPTAPWNWRKKKSKKRKKKYKKK